MAGSIVTALAIALFAGYFVGWLVTTVVGTIWWFRRYGEDLDGVIWGMLGDLVWPVVLLAFILRFPIRAISRRFPG